MNANNIRLNILTTAHRVGKDGGGVHIASSLSEVEILLAIFTNFIDESDEFILSKGHGGLGYYAALLEAGKITEKEFFSFDLDGGDFPGQPSKNLSAGIIFSSGSLGMGLSYACGRGIAKKRQKTTGRIYVLLGDGELNEGTNWEAAMFANHHNLDNIIAIVDANSMQSDGYSKDILDVDYQKLFEAMGFFVLNCDGHSIEELNNAINLPCGGKPKVIIAETIKGKGVSFMENNGNWHHARLAQGQFDEAVDGI